MDVIKKFRDLLQQSISEKSVYIRQGIWGKLKPHIWNKNREFSHKVFGGGRCPTIIAWGWKRGRESEGCSFSGFSFSTCIVFYFAFEKQNDECDKQQNIFFKLEDLILKVFTRTRILTWSWRLWENKVNIWHLDSGWLWTLIKRTILTKRFKAKGSKRE